MLYCYYSVKLTNIREYGLSLFLSPFFNFCFDCYGSEIISSRDPITYITETRGHEWHLEVLQGRHMVRWYGVDAGRPFRHCTDRCCSMVLNAASIAHNKVHVYSDPLDVRFQISSTPSDDGTFSIINLFAGLSTLAHSNTTQAPQHDSSSPHIFCPSHHPRSGHTTHILHHHLP